MDERTGYSSRFIIEASWSSFPSFRSQMSAHTQRKSRNEVSDLFSPTELSFPRGRRRRRRVQRNGEGALQTNLIDRAALTYPNKQKRVRRTRTAASAGQKFSRR